MITLLNLVLLGSSSASWAQSRSTQAVSVTCTIPPLVEFVPSDDSAQNVKTNFGDDYTVTQETRKTDNGFVRLITVTPL